jgi:hypothetical protein
MTLEKSFGFGNASKYTSKTFNRNNDLIFGRNGVLEVEKVYNSGPNVILENVTFVQKGIIVVKTDLVSETFPVSLPAPFYLTASTPDNYQVDNISWGFVRRPQDIGENTVLIAEYDGHEWRKLPSINIDGFVKDRLKQAIAYNNIGFNTGFTFSPNPTFTEYLISGGIVTDKFGTLVEKVESQTFSAIDADLEYDRIDSLFWRRSNDDPNRIGQMLLRAGPTYSGSSIVQNHLTSIGTATKVNSNPKIINFSDNTVAIFWLENYADNGVIKCIKYDVDRTSVLVVETTLDSGVFEFDACVDRDDNIMIAFIKGGNLYRKKIDSSFSVISSSTVIDGLVNSVRQPTIRPDFLGNFYITFLYEIGPTTETPYIIKINTGGTIVFPSKRLLTSANNYNKVHFDINQDLILHVAFENSSTNQIQFEKYDEFGEALNTNPTVISNNTKYDLITLSTAARNPHVAIGENNNFFVSFEQNKGSGQYGIAFYSPVYQEKYDVDAILKDLKSSSENFTSHFFYLDWGNHAHILASDGTELIYANYLLPFSNTRLLSPFVVRTANVDAFDIVYDKAGSLFVSYADASSSVSNNGSPLGALLFGADTYGTELEFLVSNEVAVDSSLLLTIPSEPAIGDTIIISGSTQGNDGTVTIEGFRDVTIDSVLHRVYSTSGSFSPEATGTIPPQAQFTAKDGTLLQFSKQTSTTSYSFQDLKAEELSTDIIAAMIRKSDNSFLTWYDQVLSPVGVNSIREESILTSAGSINWQSGVSGGTLTWSQDLYIRDPFRCSFKIASGSMANFVENAVMYIKAPIPMYLTKDGDSEGVGVASVLDTSQFSIGQNVYIGDSDSPGVTAVVQSVTTSTVVFSISLSDYATVRGAYIIPLDLTPQLEIQNEGDLRPDSQGFIDKRIYIISTRADDLMFFRDGALTLENEEDGHLGDGPGEDTLSYIGSSGDSDSDPNYTNNYLGFQGQNLTSRLSAADQGANETAQDRNVLDIFPRNIAFTWNTTTNTLTWANGEWGLGVPDVGSAPGQLHTINTATKSLAINDNQVAYVDINRSTGEGDLTPIVVNDNALPLDFSNQNHLVIARRVGDEITIGTKGKWILVNNETSAPALASAVLTEGGDWEWDALANTLSWSAAAYIQIPGLDKTVNTINSSSGVMAADGDVLYAIINRASPGGTLTVIADSNDNVPEGTNSFIIARRIGDNVLIGKNLVESNAILTIDQAFTDNMLTLLGFTDNGQTTHTYSSTYYITQSTSHEEAIGTFDTKIKQILDQLDKDLNAYIWLGNGLTDSFTIGVAGHGDSTLTFSSDNSINDVIVTLDGITLELHTDGTWPIGDGDTDGDFIKTSPTTIRLKPSLISNAGTGVNRKKLMLRPFAAGATHVVAVQEEGSTVESTTDIINFTGTGVSVTSSATGKVDVNITGGGGGGSGGGTYTTLPATNDTGSLIPEKRLVKFLDNGRIQLADNIITGRKTPMAITLQDILDGDTATEGMAIGYYMPGVLSGLGFNIGERVFLGADGQMVTEANVPDSGAYDDANVQVGIAYGTGTSATDLIWNMMDFPGF